MNNISKLRLRTNLGISQLAEECKVTPSYITKLEKGSVKISPTMMKKLKQVFNCSECEILSNEIDIDIQGNDVTFANNKNISIHRWYPYIEGFSQGFVDQILDKFPEDILVYDPFNGSGTTTLACSYRGVKSIATEVNPLMRFVANTKVNTVKSILENNKIKDLEKFISSIDIDVDTINIDFSNYINPCYINSDFFTENALKQIAFIKKIITSIEDSDIRDIARLGLAAICVECSNMIRSVDLRRRKGTEFDRVPKNVIERYKQQLNIMLNDLYIYNTSKIESMKIIGTNAKSINKEYKGNVDLIITSPPYVNGTNYFRNTKLELWILDLINNENDLKSLRGDAMTAGINNVSSRNEDIIEFEFVEKYAVQLDKLAPDKRIPKLIRAYFSDIDRVFKNFYNILKLHGVIYFDIGDSQYYNVHIPVDKIIQKIAEMNGFNTKLVNVARNRRSKNGMLLTQKVIVFEKVAKKNSIEDVVLNRIENIDDNLKEFHDKSVSFMKQLPYMKEPYNKRNWGSEWHSLCSYHGKLKPSIAHWLVKYFTDPGDIIVDPLSGVGTVPFEACLQGRIGIGNDLSKLAYIVSKAKVNRPNRQEVNECIQDLEIYIDLNKRNYSEDELPYKDFGFNKNIPEYFHKETYEELLVAREYFNSKEDLTPSECVVLASLLHVLHGNRPYALSRNSHPLTPYAPTGEYVYKRVIDHIKNKVNLVYKKISEVDTTYINNGVEEFETNSCINNEWYQYTPGEMILGDALKLDESIKIKADVIISSPPFAASIRFYVQNWMRLWFAGWEPNDFKNAESMFLESLQKNSLEIYDQFFKMCSNILKDNGKVILHLGKSDKCNMAEELSKIADPYFYTVLSADEDVSNIEKHGIKDKGATTHHQYLFLQKRH
jgi:DNA modification methylase/plasmid maintenance system antidote protein VapI